MFTERRVNTGKIFNSPKGDFREGSGNPLQYSCLENPMDGGAWWAAVHGVAKNQTWLSDFTFTFHFHALEKEMATHSSFLAWRIPETGEPGRLPSMGSHRVRHDWSELAAAAAKVTYRFITILIKILARVMYWVAKKFIQFVWGFFFGNTVWKNLNQCLSQHNRYRKCYLTIHMER